MRSVVHRSFVLLVTLSACGGDDRDGGGGGGAEGDEGAAGEADEGPVEPSPPVKICDGSSELRLAALFGSTWWSQAEAVSTENGHPFVYVDGTCRYWTSGVQGQALAGTLGPEEEARLTSALHVASWSSFPREEWSGDVADAPALVLWEPEALVSCSGGCSGEQVPQPLGSVGLALYDENELLQQGAQPIDGLMRAYAAEVGPFADDVPILEWTFEPPISEFSFPASEGNAGTEPAVIDDPDAVAALRAAWLEAQASRSVFIAARDPDGAYYQLFARDVLPFEDPEGWGVELPEP
jgi:hypothetical protein